MVRLRVRIRFSKQGDLRLIGHRDLMRCLERVFRRAGLALELQPGVPSETADDVPPGLGGGHRGSRRSDGSRAGRKLHRRRVAATFGAAMPAGARPSRDRRSSRRQARRRKCRASPTRPPSLATSRTGLGERIEHLLAASSWPIERAHGRRPIDLRPLVLELALRRGRAADAAARG